MNCRRTLPDDARFCPNCGHPTERSPADEERLNRIAASAPPTLAKKIREAPVAGERRMVSAIFADVVGSTSLMETMDPEDWTAVVNVAFDLMSQAVYRYEGTISQLQGDAMVAFFGAPVAHEDDPERAVRAALEMVSEIQTYREELQKAQGFDFQIRAGINTGLVMVGRVGTDLRYEYTALGDAMNVAARVQAAARPGAVVMTYDTYRLASGLFDVHDLGAISVKGKAEPVHAYEVIGLRAAPAPKRGIAGLRSPMVGRDTELAQLKSLLEVVKAGRGRMACIIGEPGIGKTRLLDEFESWALPQGNLRWVKAHALSYGRNFPYHLVMDLVRSCTGISPSSSKEEASEAVGAALASLSEEDRSHAFAALGHLLSLPIPQADLEFFATMDPEQLLKRYLGGLKLLINVLASSEPVVMVLEDVHWSDASSAQILTWLLALAAPFAILVVLTSRPDPDSAGWQLIESARQIAGQALTEIGLESLQDEDSQRMVSSLLEIESLPQKMRDELLTRAEGNPFFVEELIKVLIEREAIVRSGDTWVAASEAEKVELPDTVRGLLLARIDRLGEEAQHSLKVASVIGRRFPGRVLERVLATADGAGTHLEQLEGSGLIRIGAIHPELEYVFYHSLVQETAYESLLKRERRGLHRLVGEAEETLYPERREELAPELALHFEEAADERALGYLKIAAESARDRFALREARTFYERARDLLAKTDEPGSISDRVDVAVSRVEVGWTFNSPVGEVAALEGVVEEAEALGDERLLVRLYSLIGMLRQFHGEQYGVGPELTRAIDRANELSRTVDDPAIRAGPLTQMGWALSFGGQSRRGLALLEEALPLLEQQGKLIDVGITLDGMAFDYNRLGEIKLSDNRLKRAGELAEHGDPIARLDYLSAKGGILFFRNDLEAAMETAQSCAYQSEEMGVLSCSIGSHLTIGMVHIMRGRPELALTNLERSAELSTVSLRFWLPTIGAARATAEALMGNGEAAELGWEASLQNARGMGAQWVEALTLHFRGWARAAQPEPDWGEIVSDFTQAGELFEKLEMRLFVARVLKDYGAAMERAGRSNEAKTHLMQSAEMFDSMELTREAAAVRELMRSAP